MWVVEEKKETSSSIHAPGQIKKQRGGKEERERDESCMVLDLLGRRKKRKKSGKGGFSLLPFSVKKPLPPPLPPSCD